MALTPICQNDDVTKRGKERKGKTLKESSAMSLRVNWGRGKGDRRRRRDAPEGCQKRPKQ